MCLPLFPSRAVTLTADVAQEHQSSVTLNIALKGTPDSKVHGANIGPIWGRQDPGGPHVGPMNFAIWVPVESHPFHSYPQNCCVWRYRFGVNLVWLPLKTASVKMYA